MTYQACGLTFNGRVPLDYSGMDLNDGEAPEAFCGCLCTEGTTNFFLHPMGYSVQQCRTQIACMKLPCLNYMTPLGGGGGGGGGWGGGGGGRDGDTTSSTTPAGGGDHLPSCTTNESGATSRRGYCNGYICDSELCDDEKTCNGFAYGFQSSTYGYILPQLVAHNFFHVTGVTVEGDVPDSCPDVVYPGQTALLGPRVRCAPFEMPDGQYPSGYRVCTNGWEHTNCSDPARGVLECKIEGWVSTVYNRAICHPNHEIPSICDDGIERECVEVSQTCTLHKHQLCDTNWDCNPGGYDEMRPDCWIYTRHTCVRAYNGSVSLKLPLAWVRDGVRDCRDGSDEGEWETCGEGDVLRYKPVPGLECQEVFLCSERESTKGFVYLHELCDGIDVCGNENKICRVSQGLVDVHRHTG
eukprot:sb/3465199/